jgi:hypothetical protein
VPHLAKAGGYRLFLVSAQQALMVCYLPCCRCERPRLHSSSVQAALHIRVCLHYLVGLASDL